ncbi:unnamed protein product, partial [Nippostrongylus brasiliensis]|uniref:Mitochondrial inner membrane protease subunit 2 (inferred by orthology to a human protein) n=1 Tax=Nippostrongylus brasiliensis TaxID=27835 RepID=A0A0N4XQ40_NIPBR
MRVGTPVCVAATAFDIVGHPAVVTGASMSPTLEGSDARWWHRDLVWLTPWGTRRPNIGDLPPTNNKFANVFFYLVIVFFSV